MSTRVEQVEGAISRSAERPATRRQFLVIGGGLAVSLWGLGACGGDGGGSGSGDILLSDFPFVKDTVNSQVAAFNKKHPNGEVTTRVGPVDTGKAFEQLKTQFQAGSNKVDVIMGDIIWPSQFAAAGWIADLSKRFTKAEQEAFIPGVVAGNTYEGKAYGVPWFTDAGMLYYRSDLLEAAGYGQPPATWDELREMAAKIQRDAGTKNGFVFTGAQYEGGTQLGIEFIRTSGGDVLDGDKVVIDSPEAIKGLTIQQSLVADGIAPEAVANFQENEASGAFMNGDAVFMRMWPFAYDWLGDKKKSKLVEDQVGLTQVPVAESNLPRVNLGGGFNFFVNVDSDDQDKDWELIQFMTAPAQQKQLALEASLLPTRPELYSDPEIIDKLPAVRLGKEAIRNTTTPPVSPYYSDMSLAMAKQFHSNVLGDTSPEDVVSTLKEQLQSIIDRGG